MGVLGWSLPLIVLAAVPSPVVALAALAAIGLLDPWVNLGLETIPQRLAADEVLSRVYAAVEAALVGAMALGAFLAPPLAGVLGYRWTLAVAGLAVTAYALTTVARMRSLDARLSVPPELETLRRVPIFSPLTGPVLESLAHRVERVHVAGGQAVVREGDPADLFYVITAGEVEVTQAGRVLRMERADDFFGEIGLLRDVARTATVTATVDTDLLALSRADFLGAVTGQQEARTAAEEAVSRRLAV